MKSHLFLIYIVLLFVNVFLMSCKDKEGKTVQYKFKNSIIIDTTFGTNKFQDYIKKERVGYYLIFYKGPKSDSIFLPTKPLSPFCNSEINNTFGSFSTSKNIEIFVDTNANVCKHTEYIHCNKNGDEPEVDSIINYKSWLVFISNKSDSLVFIGEFNFLKNVIRQVYYNNKWKDIEYFETEYCGTGAREIYLEKNEIAIAKLIRYKGVKKYLCRIKMTSFSGVTYSNTFLDYLNEKQLTVSIIKHY